MSGLHQPGLLGRHAPTVEGKNVEKRLVFPKMANWLREVAPPMVGQPGDRYISKRSPHFFPYEVVLVMNCHFRRFHSLPWFAVCLIVAASVMACAPSTNPQAADKAARERGDGLRADIVGPPPMHPKPLTDKELADGWVSLFDGTTLFGWTPGTKANWEVKDGTIVVSDGEKGLLCTTSEFADYVLKVDFRFAKKTNSGVFLHTPIKPVDAGKDCYELNIALPECESLSHG